MNVVFAYPDYYNEFRCTAGNCRHSCCVGWEIDIDDESLARFSKEDGALGDELRKNISLENGAHFILDIMSDVLFLTEKTCAGSSPQRAGNLFAKSAATIPASAAFCPGERKSDSGFAARRPPA